MRYCFKIYSKPNISFLSFQMQEAMHSTVGWRCGWNRYLLDFEVLKRKTGQDIFLQCLITSQDVTTHRSRNQGDNARNPHEKSFIYHVMVGDKKEQVCVKAFQSLYGTKISRIRRLRNLLLLGKSPQDLCGKKSPVNAIPGVDRLKIREHIESFPVKESKFAGKVIKYLDSRLNVQIIYKMFKEKHPNVKCSYQFFVDFFKENYNLKFGRPQIDCCPKCEEL